MKTAIDTSVLVDILIDDPDHFKKSKAALLKARQEGALLICETVVAELRPLIDEKSLRSFMKELGISFSESSWESANIAGEMFAKYITRKKKTKKVVADFLIGAHASVKADRLLARDRGFYSDYFKNLKILYP